ncbi:unnamed protein product [Calicophoron daubneyi]|uniref:tRNA-binding domain-containing protein n=1 Tax=Calicophoron daubneyi TaxID=300641 RepID=A0AAV2T758_CALDB
MTMNSVQLLKILQKRLQDIRSLASPESIKNAEIYLEQENASLKSQIEALKRTVVLSELELGIFQYKIPSFPSAVPEIPDTTPHLPEKETIVAPRGENTAEATNAKTGAPLSTEPKRPRQAGCAKKEANKGGKPQADAPIDVGRLDMRVGRIMEVSKHPDADSLYVEKVDLGEGRLRTVVSGLVKFVPIESMQNRVGIFLCNLKPAKMRGVESEAMLMCATNHDAGTVEPLVLSNADVQLGTRVTVPGYELNPDEQLNPKKKIFEQIKPDLVVDDAGYATYKGARWTLADSAETTIKATSLRNVQIA